MRSFLYILSCRSTSYGLLSMALLWLRSALLKYAQARQAALAAGLKRNFGFRNVSTEAAAQH